MVFAVFSINLVSKKRTIFKGFNDFIRFCIFLYLSFMFIKAVFNRVDDVDDKKGRQKSNHHNGTIHT